MLISKFKICVMALALAISVFGVGSAEAQDAQVTLVIDNLVLSEGHYTLEFALSPGGIPTSQPIDAKAGAGPIKATLAVNKEAQATGWVFVIRDSQEIVQLRAAGPFPPQATSSYTEFFLAKPGIIDSGNPDAALGQIQFPHSAVRFFFEIEFAQLAATAPYTGSVWVDDNDNAIMDEPEKHAFDVSAAGKVVRGTVSLPLWTGLKDFQIDVMAGDANRAVLKGKWNFDLNKPDKLDPAGAPYPVFFGFQPVTGVGTFALPNIFPQLKKPVLSPEEVVGVTWAVRIGPEIQVAQATPTPSVAPTSTPSPTPAPELTASPEPTQTGTGEVAKGPPWVWVIAGASLILVIFLIAIWLARRQRSGTQF